MIKSTAGITRGPKKYIPMSADEKEDMRISFEIAEEAHRPIKPRIAFDFHAVSRLKSMGKTYILRKEEYIFRFARARQLKNAPLYLKKLQDVRLSRIEDPPAALHKYATAAGYPDAFEWENAAKYNDKRESGTYFLYEVRTRATPAPGQMTLSGEMA